MSEELHVEQVSEIEPVAEYQAPKLEIYGEMATLTAGGTSGNAEGRLPRRRRRA